MTNVAKFTVNSDPSSNKGYDATNGQTLVLQLEGTPNVVVQRVNFSVYDASDPSSPLASKDAPTLVLDNGSGSTGQNVQATTPASSVTTSAPASGTHSFLVRATVNGGVDYDGNANPDYVFERLIVVRSPSGTRKEVFGEAAQYSSRGPADAQNEMVDVVGSGIGAVSPITGQRVVAGVAATPGWEVLGAFVAPSVSPKLQAMVLVSQAALTARIRVFGPVGGTPAEVAGSLLSSTATAEEVIASSALSLSTGETYQIQMECTGGALATDFAVARYAAMVKA